MRYYKSREACAKLRLHPNTLRCWADSGKIECVKTASGQRLYDVDKWLGIQTKPETIIYCRVSSHKQKEDLENQIKYLQSKYPEARVVKDIGSGLNFKRKGLKAVLEQAMSGSKLEVVVAHRDRLARFGFDLLRFIIERTGGRIVVLDRTVLSPEQELTADLLNILHVFSYRMHGLRNYKVKVEQALADPQTKEDV